MKIPNQQTYFLEQNLSFEQWQYQVIHFRDTFEKNPAQTWLLFEQDSYLFSILFFALIAANKRIILPPSGQIKQLEQSMAHADIFVGSQQLSSINQFELSYPIDNMTTSNQKTNQLALSPDAEIIFFTSGSSGQPKAVGKKFIQLILEVEALEKAFSHLLESHQNALPVAVMSTVSHQHIYGLLFKLLWPIWSGRDVYLKAFKYPEHLVHQAKQLEKHRICLISSPAYYHRLLKDNRLVEIKEQLVSLFSSGGPLDAHAAVALLQSLGLTPIEVFGSTETGGIAWRQNTSENNHIWQAFDGIECISEQDTQRLGLKSPYIQTQNKADSQQWYITDDRVELINSNADLNNQQFILLGRADRIVKIEEKRCSLDEIQAQLEQNKWVNKAYTLAIGGKNGKRQSTAAVVELNSIGNEQLEQDGKFKFDQQIKSDLKQYFEALIVPRKFRYLEQLPYNSQGKLNKLALEALFE